MKLIPILAAATLFLAACGDDSKTPAAPAATRSAPYKIELTFSPRTIEKLKILGEKVTVSSSFFGMAKPGAVKGDTTGQVSLGESPIQVEPANQIVTASTMKFSEAEMKNVEGEPILLINVFTARSVTEDNLITCGIFEGPVSKATAAPIAIECDLIEPEVIEPPQAPAPISEP